MEKSSGEIKGREIVSRSRNCPISGIFESATVVSPHPSPRSSKIRFHRDDDDDVVVVVVEVAACSRNPHQQTSPSTNYRRS